MSVTVIAPTKCTHAAGEATRERILGVLRAAGGPMRLKDISAAMGITDAAVHTHLCRLKAACRVTGGRVGREARYAILEFPSPAAQAGATRETAAATADFTCLSGAAAAGTISGKGEREDAS